VHVSSRWFGPAGAPAAAARDGLRTRLPAALPPGERCVVRVPLLAPEPGSWELRLTAVQEQVAWFDDLDPASGLRARVEVAPARAAQPSAVPAGAGGETA
jgi:hypothetical protein